MLSDSQISDWNVPSAVSSSSIYGFSSDGWRFGNASSFSRIPLNFEVAYPVSVEFTVNNRVWLAPIAMFMNNNNNYIAVSYGEGGNLFRYKENGAGMPTGDVNYNLLNGSIIRLELTSDTIKTYVNDNLIDTRNHSFNQTGLHFYFETGGSRENTIKNFKIQPL